MYKSKALCFFKNFFAIVVVVVVRALRFEILMSECGVLEIT